MTVCITIVSVTETSFWVLHFIGIASSSVVHSIGNVTSSIVYIVVMMMEVDAQIYMISVTKYRKWSPSYVIGRIIIPIPRRAIRSVVTNPKICINYWCRIINRFIDVVVSIHVHIANYLNLNSVVSIFLYFYGCNVLI